VALGTPERPLAAFGEVGLTGELRSVGHPDRRREEAAKFGLADVVAPPRVTSLRAALRAAFATARDEGPVRAA
jgi:DNA repair protein RadA/Sms